MSTLRVLVVDDEVPNLLTFQRVYRKHYDIQLASSGAAGLQLLAEHEFDVVMVDYAMPLMTGAEFVDGARRVQRVSIVLVTGYTTHPDVLELEASGEIFALVGKPWDRQLLMDMIARASAHTRSLRNLPGSLSDRPACDPTLPS